MVVNIFFVKKCVKQVEKCCSYNVSLCFMVCIYIKNVVKVIDVKDLEKVQVVFIVVVLVIDCMVDKGIIYKNKVVCYKSCLSGYIKVFSIVVV